LVAGSINMCSNWQHWISFVRLRTACCGCTAVILFLHLLFFTFLLAWLERSFYPAIQSCRALLLLECAEKRFRI
jgi:hypothetical protein